MGEVFSGTINVIFIVALAIGAGYWFFGGVKLKDAMRKRKSKKVVE